MANGLMDFAEGFALTFGQGIADNIRKRGAEEDKYVRDTVSLMRQRIANGKAKESQIKNEVRKRIEVLQGQFPGFDDADIKAAAANEFKFQEIQKLRANDDEYKIRDQDKVGKWYKGGKVDPYTSRVDQIRAPGTTLLSEIFVPVKLDPEKPVEEDNILRTLFGAPTDPEKLQRMAEDRVVSQRGMGALDATGATDLDRYYARGGTVRQPTAPGTGNIGRPLPKSATPKVIAPDLRAAKANLSLNINVLKRMVQEGTAADPQSQDPAESTTTNQKTINRFEGFYKAQAKKAGIDGKLPTNFFRTLERLGLTAPSAAEKVFAQLSLNNKKLQPVAADIAKTKEDIVMFNAYIDLLRDIEATPGDFKDEVEMMRRIQGGLGLNPATVSNIGSPESEN